jgi:hypothetical protein
MLIEKWSFTPLLLCALLLLPVAAHQPALVRESLTIVNDPEVSQAFYGELHGSPAYFQIQSSTGFDLYVQLTLPDVPGIGKDVSARITKDGDPGFIEVLDGTNHTWTPFYEEFGGDEYWSGPEFNQTVGPGTYTIEVYRPVNQGTYVFVVGEKEEFPLDVTLRTLFLLPVLKTDYFQKPPYAVLFSRMGVLYLPFILGAFFLVGLIVWLFKRKRKKAKR